MPSKQRRLRALELSREKHSQWAFNERKRLGVINSSRTTRIGGVWTEKKIRRWAKQGWWDRVRHMLDLNVNLPKDIVADARMMHECQCCGKVCKRTWCDKDRCFGSYNSNNLKLKLWDATAPYKQP